MASPPARGARSPGAAPAACPQIHRYGSHKLATYKLSRGSSCDRSNVIAIIFLECGKNLWSACGLTYWIVCKLKRIGTEPSGSELLGTAELNLGSIGEARAEDGTRRARDRIDHTRLMDSNEAANQALVADRLSEIMLPLRPLSRPQKHRGVLFGVQGEANRTTTNKKRVGTAQSYRHRAVTERHNPTDIERSPSSSATLMIVTAPFAAFVSRLQILISIIKNAPEFVKQST